MPIAKTTTNAVEELMREIYHMPSGIQERKKAWQTEQFRIEPTKSETKKEGLPLGIGSPKGRVP
jgi:hypothetical protein